jgi:hypothetical protein
MNNFQRENWKKIKDYMERVDKTNNPYYRRAVKVVETGTDPGEFFENEYDCAYNYFEYCEDECLNNIVEIEAYEDELITNKQIENFSSRVLKYLINKILDPEFMDFNFQVYDDIKIIAETNNRNAKKILINTFIKKWTQKDKVIDITL